MPQFKTFEEADKHGRKNYFHPVIDEVKTVYGTTYYVYDSWEVDKNDRRSIRR